MAKSPKKRKDTLVLNNFLSIISNALTGLSSVITDYEFIVFSRLFCGICAGIFSCAIPLYLGEISPVDLRGATIVMPMLFVNIGALLGLIMGHPKILGTKKGLPVFMSLAIIPAFLSIFLLRLIPESPRYLLLQKSNEEKATRALKKLRERENVEEEMQELYQEDISERGEKNMNVLKLIRFRTLRWQVLSIIILMGGQQLSGIHMAFVYMGKVDQIIAVKNYQVAAIGLVSIFITVLSYVVLIHIIDSMGRRIPLLFGYGITNILSILLTMTLELERLGAFVFLIFWPICTITFIYSIKVIPETQQKSFITIKKLMALYMARKKMVKGPARDDFKRHSARSSRRSSSKRSSSVKTSAKSSVKPSVKP
ncbi:solute carrier family 2, facilitated glucose transporter member 5-like [Tiliqua scincoides]|uniref:solute carrier family 2, facilitated glucose transporter member 5-like n=1 Tax=Tiliqua scincoides TaxID=71010 RepID=UPI003463324F